GSPGARSPQPAARRRSAAQPPHVLPALIAYGSPKLYTEAHGQRAEWTKAQPPRRISGPDSDISRVTGVLERAHAALMTSSHVRRDQEFAHPGNASRLLAGSFLSRLPDRASQGRVGRRREMSRWSRVP